MPIRLFYLLVASQLVRMESPSVRMQIRDREYVKICCGEPCEWLTFQLNRTLSAIYLHNYKFAMQSRTFFHSESGLGDSEYFQFADTRYRLPVYLVSKSTTLPVKETMSADGTLGLGEYSPLWEHWSNYSLSSKRLVFGEYDNFGQFEYTERPPVLKLDQTNYITLGDNSLVPIEFSIYSVETYIPYPLNISAALSSVTFQTEDCTVEYNLLNLASGNTKPISCKNINTLRPNKRQDVKLFNGADYDAVRYTSSNQFLPGARFFSEFFSFRNIITHQLILTNDAYSMDYGDVMTYASIFITLTLGFWCQIVQSKTERKDNFEFFFTQMAEATCYLLDLMVLWVAFGMLNWDRYISHYTSSEPLFAKIFVLTLPALSMAYWLYGLYTVSDYKDYSKRFKHTGFFHAVLFITSQLTIVWLCFVKDHESSFERATSAFVINVALIYQIFVVLWYYLSEHPVEGTLTLLIAVASNIFNVFYTIKPIFQYSNFREQFASFCVIWIFFLELLPALLVFTSVYSYPFYIAKRNSQTKT